MFEEYEEANEMVMVVDQTLLKQVVLKKMKADWSLSKAIVFEDQGGNLKVAPILSKQVQDDECGDV